LLVCQNAAANQRGLSVPKTRSKPQLRSVPVNCSKPKKGACQTVEVTQCLLACHSLEVIHVFIACQHGRAFFQPNATSAGQWFQVTQPGLACPSPEVTHRSLACQFLLADPAPQSVPHQRRNPTSCSVPMHPSSPTRTSVPQWASNPTALAAGLDSLKFLGVLKKWPREVRYFPRPDPLRFC